VDKVLNWYFAKIGTDGTRVNEAWILVKHQGVKVTKRPAPVNFLLRMVRALADIAVVGTLIFLPILRFLDSRSGTNRFTGRTVRHHAPPPDPRTPYLMVFFRDAHYAPPHPYGFYWLQWGEAFYAPARSLYSSAPPVPVDRMLGMMCGEP
jgi:hypothetical protein